MAIVTAFPIRTNMNIVVDYIGAELAALAQSQQPRGYPAIVPDIYAGAQIRIEAHIH